MEKKKKRAKAVLFIITVHTVTVHIAYRYCAMSETRASFARAAFR
jgi:hypothetical protein